MSTQEELEADQRKIARGTREAGQQLQLLIAHPGWKHYMALIESVAQNFHEKAMAPLEDMNGVPKAEYAKGTLNGLSMAATLPRLKIQEAQDLNLTPTEE